MTLGGVKIGNADDEMSQCKRTMYVAPVMYMCNLSVCTDRVQYAEIAVGGRLAGAATGTHGVRPVGLEVLFHRY